MEFRIDDKYFSDEELKNTPNRFKRFLDEWLKQDNDFNFTTFKNPGYDEMIIVKDIIFYSMCSHHLIPFFGKAHFGYIPDKRICGLSKIPRIIDMFAHRPQIQEKLTIEALNYLTEHLQPKWAMLILEAEHLCMSMRGIKKPGHITITNAVFNREKAIHAKEEFLEMIK